MSRGKLGFAIMKINTPYHVRIVLYDSAKNTLSHTTVTQKLEITHKDNYITYYDDLQKNWSLLCSSSQDCHSIIDELKKYSVDIKMEDTITVHPVVPQKPSHLILHTKDTSDKESDTDSSVNKKTKKSLLHRMAMMGQSIIPPQPLNDVTSDSSDTNEYINNHHKIVRHKPIKNYIKKVNQDKINTDLCQNTSQNIVSNIQSSTISPVKKNNSDIIPLYTYINGQLVPVTHTNVLNKSVSDVDIEKNDNINVMISEQRVSNSELRININRMSDKIDQILDKVKICENPVNMPSSFTNEIYQKLLAEYENKIKDQDNKIKLLENKINDYDKNNFNKPCSLGNNQNTDTLRINYEIKIAELEAQLKEKEIESSLLKNQLDNITNQVDNESKQKLQLNITEPVEIEQLKNDYLKVINELENEKKKCNALETNLDKTVKIIMNKTYQTLSAYFDNNSNYSGDTVKNVITTVIKKTTKDSLH